MGVLLLPSPLASPYGMTTSPTLVNCEVSQISRLPRPAANTGSQTISVMASGSYKFRPQAPHHNQFICTRTHQIGALFLVVATFFFTRLFDHSFIPCSLSVDQVRPSLDLVHGGPYSWPERGYGSQLSLKIYVYDVEEIDGLKVLMYGREGKITENACLKGQWGTQVLSQMPYFRLSGGRNHIFVFPSGAGAHLFKSWATYINRSIILTPEGDRTDKRDASAFNTWKDIIIPGNIDDGVTKTGAPVVQPLPLSKRKYLANYLGRAQGKASRLQLIQLAKQYPDKLECPDLKFNGPDKLGRKEYFEHLRNAKFCLAPRGESSWTLRFYESYFVECVPVILSDQVELPFQNVIDYSQISIKWPSSRIGAELLQYLETIPDEDIEAIIARGRQVRCLWVYASDSAPCSAMRGIMWELQRKVRQFHQSAETFWLHNGSIVNRNLVEFSRWDLPVPLP
ncbi:probable glycosyltransferase At5g11130 isoform X2 [Prosopis cineraria]|uniref:probable glycosyltransferase At5g11130 isoform X2 n=1 Tax=Prosopis cineraria TaxID=364024 RepID=UPI00241066B5|nr:probable glycosyltransferase At5g11130 isoform X2 [Prosopis cineraria]